MPGPHKIGWRHHTIASAWLRVGMPVRVVSQRLGHASVTIMADVHAHVLPQEQDQHVDRVAARMALGHAETGITEPDLGDSKGETPVSRVA
jgi:hypothetical protein